MLGQLSRQYLINKAPQGFHYEALAGQSKPIAWQNEFSKMSIVIDLIVPLRRPLWAWVARAGCCWGRGRGRGRGRGAAPGVVNAGGASSHKEQDFPPKYTNYTRRIIGKEKRALFSFQ